MVAACGLFVKEIIAAVPITKQFELFRPKNAGAGGMIQVAMNFKTPEENTPAKGGRITSAHKIDTATFKRGAEFTPLEGEKKGGPLKKLIVLGALAGGAFAAFKKWQDSQA